MKQNLAKEGCKLYLRVICSLPAFDLCLMYNPSLISAFAAPGLKQRFQELTTVHNLKSNICLPPSSSSIITKKHPWYLLTPVAPNLLSNPCIGQLFHRFLSNSWPSASYFPWMLRLERSIFGSHLRWWPMAIQQKRPSTNSSLRAAGKSRISEHIGLKKPKKKVQNAMYQEYNIHQSPLHHIN